MKVLHSICTIFAPMKARNILILILGTLILPIYLTSCGVDRWKEYAGQTQTDRWIDDTMRVWYYWVDAIPHTNDLNYFQAPFTFFASLKSEEDKFSTIDSLVSYPQHPLYGLQLRIPVHYQPDRSRRRRECHCCTDSLRCRRKPGLGNRAKTGWLDYEDGRELYYWTEL